MGLRYIFENIPVIHVATCSISGINSLYLARIELTVPTTPILIEFILYGAMTSASLKNHRIHKVSWDCRDASGKLVPDGAYRIRVEFSEVNGPGPATPETHIEFTKGPKAQSLRPKDMPNFTKMSLAFRPSRKRPGLSR